MADEIKGLEDGLQLLKDQNGKNLIICRLKILVELNMRTEFSGARETAFKGTNKRNIEYSRCI